MSVKSGEAQDEFYDIGWPGSDVGANEAVSLLDDLKTAFAARLKELQKIGHSESITFAKQELDMIAEAHRLLDAVMEGYLI